MFYLGLYTLHKRPLLPGTNRVIILQSIQYILNVVIEFLEFTNFLDLVSFFNVANNHVKLEHNNKLMANNSLFYWNTVFHENILPDAMKNDKKNGYREMFSRWDTGYWAF